MIVVVVSGGDFDCSNCDCRCLAAIVVVAEHDIEGEYLLCGRWSAGSHARAGLRYIMSRMGEAAASKPTTSDEKQRQKLLWCVACCSCC
jgi:hypothetical protein